MRLGAKIRQLRKERGISQEKLANICGISRSHVYYIEHEKHKPRIDTVQKIAEGLSVDVAELFRKE